MIYHTYTLQNIFIVYTVYQFFRYSLYKNLYNTFSKNEIKQIDISLIDYCLEVTKFVTPSIL